MRFDRNKNPDANMRQDFLCDCQKQIETSN